jgi:hypothetical protein
VAIVAEPAAASIAGLDGWLEWGEAATVSPADAAGADVVVALGAVEVTGGEPDVRLASDGRAAAPGAGAAAPAERSPAAADPTAGAGRLVATAGDGLWSRSAWPVRDDLFELAAAGPAAGLLVVTDDEARDAALLEKLAGRGIAATTAAELSAEGLAGAAAVAFPPSADEKGDYVPGARQEALPAAAFAVLAAGRPLIAPRARTDFGVHAGVDHLAASTDDDVVQYADALRAMPEAFALQLALGRIAAERQRASVFYGRLLDELTA